MDVEARNKYCGLIMFNTLSISPESSPSPSFINSNNNSNQFSNYSNHYTLDSTSPSNYLSKNENNVISAGAAAVNDNKNNNNGDGNNNSKSNNDDKFDSSPNSDSDNSNKVPGSSKLEPEKRPPRPPNAFILYRRAKQPAILAANRHLTNAEISRYISELWRNETKETKLEWERYADQKKLEHMQAYPNYVYRPNKNKGKNEKRKQQRKNTALSSSSSSSSSSSIDSTSIIDMNRGETGPIRIKKMKGNNRFDIGRLSIPNIHKNFVTANYHNMMNYSAMASHSLLQQQAYPDTYTSFSGVSSPDMLSTPITPISLQEQLEQLQTTLWRIVPSQDVLPIQSQEENNLTHLSFHDLSIAAVPTFREETVDPSLIFLNDDDPNLIYNSHPATII